MDSLSTAPVPPQNTNSSGLSSNPIISYKPSKSTKTPPTATATQRIFASTAKDVEVDSEHQYNGTMISTNHNNNNHSHRRLLTLLDEDYDDSADVVLHTIVEAKDGHEIRPHHHHSHSSLARKFENLQLHTALIETNTQTQTTTSPPPLVQPSPCSESRQNSKDLEEGIVNIGPSLTPILTLTTNHPHSNQPPPQPPHPPMAGKMVGRKCRSQSSSSSSPTTSSSILIESPLSPTAPSCMQSFSSSSTSNTTTTTTTTQLPPLFNPQTNAKTRQFVAKAQSLDLGSDEDDHFHRHSTNTSCIVDGAVATHQNGDDVEPKLMGASLRQNVLQPQRLRLDSQPELSVTNNAVKMGMLPKMQSTDSRPIYPNVPYSPYGSPYGSPRSNRRRTPLRESRRISIEKSGSFLQLNQYKLMDQIGQGSYGLVKLAYSEEDSTHYAMKILSKRRLLRKAGLMGRGPKKTTSPLDRVYREIAVLKKLDHPNVVKLVEVLDDPLEDSLYLVFELVRQGEILGVPTDKPLTEERTWSVFRDALQGLEYLHYQRIIHADIKPGNLLLAECGRVKIADLGVCNEFMGEDATLNNGSTAGTPAFRAPETLIPGQHLYSGKAADIWALGATLYSLVFGNVPFLANSVPGVYEKIKNDSLTFPDNQQISSELRDLIEKLLTKDPSQRITLPQIKEHSWVTANGAQPLPTEEENCRLVQISEEDINSVVKSIPKLDTLILIKTMLKNHSFLNPFTRGVSGRAPQRGGSRLERFTRAGRSNSAPGAYHLAPDRQLSCDSILPALSESVTSSNNESSDG